MWYQRRQGKTTNRILQLMSLIRCSTCRELRCYSEMLKSLAMVSPTRAPIFYFWMVTNASEQPSKQQLRPEIRMIVSFFTLDIYLCLIIML